MRQLLSFLVKFCLTGTFLAATAWPQTGAEWTIDTIAGRGVGNIGPGVQAQLAYPFDVAVDSAGNLYIADTSNHRIVRADIVGTITTFAGTGARGFSGDGGPAVQALLNDPFGVAVDTDGNLYIADTSNHRIARVDIAGTITTFAGTGEKGFSGDGGPAVQALLDRPRGVAVDGAGNLYIADSFNQRIRRVDIAGTITTFAGTGEKGFSGDGGPAVQTLLNDPFGVAVDTDGNLYIADTSNHRIARVDIAGTITTFAGTGEKGFSGDGGPAAQALLNGPFGVAVDGAGNLYIADSFNQRIRRVDIAGTITTFAGTGEKGFSGDGGPAVAARLSFPTGLGVDGAGNLYIADSDNQRIRVLRQTASLPPTLTRFSPASGPAGTRVTLTGTQFLGATDVLFNGVRCLDFEVVSGTSIEAVVPPGASSGPISVVTPGGTVVSNDPFTVTSGGIHSRLFVPIVLRSQGRTPGSFFTSELTLTNRGSRDAAIQYTYTASIGTGSGTALDSLEAGQQRVIPDAIAYLTALGVPIGGGSAGGTLLVDFSNLSAASDAAVTVRVSTPVEAGSGSAGLAYLGLDPNGLLAGPAFITGLRQNSQDRSNVALQNTGDSSQESVTLRVTVFSGDSASAGRSVVLPDLSLPPGGFHQYNSILNKAGFANGYAKVERVRGTAAYYAYGVINDNFNSDGSFVFPLSESSLVGTSGQTLPVIIETGNFQSELTVTNFSASDKTVNFSFVADAIQTAGDTTIFSLRLKAGEQIILPNLVNWLRQQGVAGIGPAGRSFAGALFATAVEGDMSGIVIGARTGSPDQRGGQYSLFYNAVPYGSASMDSAWIYGLQQNAENRSNLALVNTGEIDDSSSTFEITVYDGGGNSRPRTITRTVGPRRWTQENGILGNVSQGYVQVRKVSGSNPFITYGVINDGGRPGERSGDGAFLLSQE